MCVYPTLLNNYWDKHARLDTLSSSPLVPERDPSFRFFLLFFSFFSTLSQVPGGEGGGPVKAIHSAASTQSQAEQVERNVVNAGELRATS